MTSTPPDIPALACCRMGLDATPAWRELVARLGLPEVESPEGMLVLALTHDGLALRDGRTRPATVTRVDFAAPSFGYRSAAGRVGAELLAKAVGKPAGQRIVDATAGFGRDAFLLAAAGHRVTALERVPVTAALLADGVRRALADPACAPVAARIEVVEADARLWLASLTRDHRPDTVYCDPIFPDKGKTAAVKKDMRHLRLLAGQDTDAQALFAAARAAALRRVVVKRWSGAPPLAGTPAHAVCGKTIRYDIYLTEGGG